MALTSRPRPTLPAHPDPATDAVLHSGLLQELSHAFGAPFHFLLPERFDTNLTAFRTALADAGVEGLVYFAKKANKAAAYVERCAQAGAGVDVAGHGELREALGHGVRGENIVVTGPAKADQLLRVAVLQGSLIAVDSLDELDRVRDLAAARPARILLRRHPPSQPESRFGLNDRDLHTALGRCQNAGERIRMEGFSFHLSGYAVQPRADLAGELLELCLKARAMGLVADRISIGGGFAVDYTSAEHWQRFLAEQLPEHYHAGKSFTARDFYPYHSPVAGADALRAVLAARPGGSGDPLAQRLRETGVLLLLEPGRALLDRAGATVFRVQGVKDRDGYGILTVDGTSLSLSEQWFNSEYLPDPILLSADGRPAPGVGAVFPACVGGASCLDSDLLTWRQIPSHDGPRSVTCWSTPTPPATRWTPTSPRSTTCHCRPRSSSSTRADACAGARTATTPTDPGAPAMTTDALRRPPVVTRVSDLIGYTPLFELCRTETGSRLLLKLEMYNPTGTAKIRMARQMILDAEERGELRAGGRIIESTSGNTGLGLAVIAAERGYTFTAVVDNHAALDKLRGMKAMGAELVHVVDDGAEELATAAREEYAEELARGKDNTIFTEQHNNPSNAVGYYPVARELDQALDGRIDVFIGAVGTGGGLCGTAKELRRTVPAVSVVGVEPKGSIAFGPPAHDYYQSGTGTPEGATIGVAVDYDLIDEGVKVGDIEAFATARVLARRTGLLIGGSAGGVVHAALGRMADLPPDTTVVALINDGGEKYLDTVFNDDWLSDRKLLDPGVERDIDELLAKLGTN